MTSMKSMRRMVWRGTSSLTSHPEGLITLSARSVVFISLISTTQTNMNNKSKKNQKPNSKWSVVLEKVYIFGCLLYLTLAVGLTIQIFATWCRMAVIPVLVMYRVQSNAAHYTGTPADPHCTPNIQSTQQYDSTIFITEINLEKIHAVVDQSRFRKSFIKI